MNIIKTISKVVDLMSSLFDDYDDCDEENVNAFEQKESIYSQSIHRKQENIQKICEVTIKGTLQNNGPLIVNKTFLTERVIGQKFMGANRYEVLEVWLMTNYPGCKIPNIRNFGVNVRNL